MVASITYCVFLLLNIKSVFAFSVNKMPSICNSDNVKHLTIENINKNIGRDEFDFQGPVYQRALELKKELELGVKKPFKNILESTVGDHAACGQMPDTFIRQVTALACLPDLLNDTMFPSDVKSRVINLLQNCQGNSIGSLTDTVGLKMVRTHIAQFIQQRDNHPSDWKDIIIVPGVSAAVKVIFKLMNLTSNGLPAGAMIPIPQFPKFTKTLSEFGMEKICYYLNEENGWSLDVDELYRALVEGSTHCYPRALLVVNPGNPTGQVLQWKNIEEIIKFANKEKILIVAVEVYQENVYNGHVFHSFKKVMFDMGAPYNQTELVSLMSCSKGYAGVYGLRAGYMELVNISPPVKDILKESIMISDSPPVCAQIALDCITNPPMPGDPSHSLFHLEKTALLVTLGEKASIVNDFVNSIPGMSCSPIKGAFFAFVKVDIPKKAIIKSKSMNLCPSTFYSLEMLESSGVLIIPGERFGQKSGTYHFRMTILLPDEMLKEVLQRIEDFHIMFMDQYK